MQALAPAESALSALGVGPLGYAMLTISPIALGLVSPLMWGRLWDHNRELAFVLAPSGEMLGAVFLAIGLYLHLQGVAAESEASQPLDSVFLALGFLLISACKAGVAIAEFSTVGRICGRHSAFGFACVVLVKHAAPSAAPTAA